MKRDKKIVLMFLFVVIILSVLINISSNIIWGMHTINSSDEYRHFAKARQIAYHNINIFQLWDDPQHYDLYPPGFHIFLASFMLLTNDYNTYNISFIFRIMFSITISLVIFVLGKKLNPYVGILSVLFYNTFFLISTFVGRIGEVSYVNAYPHVVSHQSYLATYLITHLTLFISLFFYFNFLKSGRSNEIKYGLLILMASIVHGLSHISTFIGFIANFGFFVVFISVLYLIKGKKEIVYKNIKIFIIIIISLSVIFFIYYYPMMGTLLTSKYKIHNKIPQQIPPDIIPLLSDIFAATLLISLIFLFYFLWKKTSFTYTHIILNKKYVIILAPLYAVLYVSILFLVTEFPQNYNYSGFQLLNGVFPTYLPTSYNMLSFYSMLIGFAMFVISFISIFFSLKTSNRFVIYISIMYLSFYMVWYAFAIIIQYYADRIIYFNYILPFIYALGLLAFYNKLKLFKKHLKLDVNLKKFIVIVFISVVVFTNVVAQINTDAPVRESMDLSNPLRMGVNNPPTITWSLSVAVNTLTDKNEYILTSKEVGDALVGTTHVRSPALHYNTLIIDHKNWSLRHNAFFGTDRYREIFFNRYDGRYLVVGVMDVTIGGEVPGQLAPVKQYDKSPHLLLVYSKGYGERMYIWVK